MGFLTRLIAGFVAASTLGAGLAGTANAVDAAGAASDTTGAVTTTADDTGGRTVLDCRQSGEGATGPYADKFCWIDWSNLPLDSSGKPTPVRINVPGGHIDADATITHTDNAALTAKDYTGSKWSRLTSAYKLTGNTALAFSGRMGRQDTGSLRHVLQRHAFRRPDRHRRERAEGLPTRFRRRGGHERWRPPRT